jgi:HK97 family phage major capsid protein
MASDFGALIPLDLGREIIQEAKDQSAVLSLARVQRMASSQQDTPVLSALPQAGFVTAPLFAKPATEIQWSSLRITAEEVAATLPVPNATLDDARFNIWGEIRPALAEAIAKCIDDAILSAVGAPTSFPAGGVMAAAAPPIQVADPPDQPDVVQAISDAMSAVEGWGLQVSGSAARTTVRGALRNLRSERGDWLVVPPTGNGQLGSLWGEPLAYTKIGFNPAATPDIIVGDWTKLVLGLREDMRFDISTEGVLRNPANGQVTVSAFQDDVSIMRVYMRLGYAIGRPVVNRPNGTQGLGNPFKSVKLAAGALAAMEAEIAQADAEAEAEAETAAKAAAAEGEGGGGRGRRNAGAE